MALVDAFITFDELAEFLSFTDDDRADVRKYEAIIQGVTSWIELKTGRRFLLRDTAVSANNFIELYDGNEIVSTIYPKNWPIVNIVSIHDDLDLPPTFGAASLLVEGEDYVLDNNEKNMIHTYVSLGNGRQNVRVEYQAGYDPDESERDGGLPESLKLLCKEMASFHIGQIGIENIASVTSGQLAERTKSYRSNIPDSAMEILQYYRRRDL